MDSGSLFFSMRVNAGSMLLPYLTAETLVLRTAHRISFGNKNRGGHSHRQTWFCGISRRWELHSSGPEPASSHHPSSWLGPCKTQTAGAISCRQMKGREVRQAGIIVFTAGPRYILVLCLFFLMMVCRWCTVCVIKCYSVASEYLLK